MSIKEKDFQAISAGSMAADIVSDYFDIRFNLGVSVQVVWSAGSTPVGDLRVEATNDDFENEAPTNWNLAVSAVSSVTGNTGSALINIPDANYTAMRIFYDRTSGSGTLNARVCIKGV